MSWLKLTFVLYEASVRGELVRNSGGDELWMHRLGTRMALGVSRFSMMPYLGVVVMDRVGLDWCTVPVML